MPLLENRLLGFCHGYRLLSGKQKELQPFKAQLSLENMTRLRIGSG
jgi:hypothetical protein